jgi:hypothetical protein
MFPGHIDGWLHIIRQDDELWRPVVVMAAKANDVDLSHSGRKIAQKCGGEQGGRQEIKPLRDDGNFKVIKNEKQKKIFSILI